MVNLFRMDFYRMRKARSFLVCLILAFLLSLCSTPLVKLLTVLMKLLSDDCYVHRLHYSKFLSRIESH